MTIRNLLALGLLTAAVLVAGCGPQAAPPKGNGKPAAPAGGADDHDHGDGPHGGTILEFGKYHGEFCMDHAKKQATVYILDEDVKNAVPIAADTLLLSIKNPRFQVEMKPDPQANDPVGRSSRFVATHDNFGKEQEFEGTVSGKVSGKPYLGDFKEKPHADHKHGEDKKKAGEKDAHGRAMPTANDATAADVYLKPGGIYTEADIRANGNTTVAVKYKGLKVAHDLNPKAGEKVCPVTLTKANAELKWVIGGKSYEFCCPPCVEEFVTLAKTKPAEVKPPEAYIQK